MTRFLSYLINTYNKFSSFAVKEEKLGEEIKAQKIQTP